MPTLVYSRSKTPQLRRFLLRLRDGRALSHEVALIDSKLIAKLHEVYPVKVAYVVGTVFMETPKFERRKMAFYEERIRCLIANRTLDAWGDHENANPFWMQYTEIRFRR